VIGNNAGMRRPIALLAFVLALAGATTPASATTPTSLVITVKSITIASIPRDAPPKGAGPGDQIVMRDRLVNTRRQFGKPAGATVGRDEGILRFTSATSGTFDGVATLPGGTIRLRGIIHDGIQTFTIAGGSGKYASARGTIAIGSGKSPLNTYRISFPREPDPVV
jgi:hypothetical protein